MNTAMTILGKIVYGVVYVVSLLIIHPILFVYRWLVFVATNIAAMVRAVWRWLRRGK